VGSRAHRPYCGLAALAGVCGQSRIRLIATAPIDWNTVSSLRKRPAASTRARRIRRAISLAFVFLAATLGCQAPPFQDGNVKVQVDLHYAQTPAAPKNVVDVLVEIWSLAPRPGLAGYAWAKDAEGRTDALGHLSVDLPFSKQDVKYALRIFPKSGGASCCYGWSPNEGQVFIGWVEPGADVPGGTPQYETARNPGDVVKFDHTFTGDWGSVFNTLDVLGHAAAFARANKTDTSDAVGVARIGLAGKGPNDASWFDPVYYTMNLTPDDRWRDLTILHEYAHYLQAQMGSLAWIPSEHNGCTPNTITVIRPGGAVSSYQGNIAPPDIRMQQAWLEGFADWFAEAARWSDPASYDPPASMPPGGGQPPSTLESSSCTPEPSERVFLPNYGDVMENHVAAYLWDLTDAFSSSEPWDRLGGPDMTRQVFAVFDRDLDTPAWPTVITFTQAMSGRGGSFATDGFDIAGNNKVTWPFQ
jgi:hypothetical protein